jgi:hypothetical protein
MQTDDDKSVCKYDIFRRLPEGSSQFWIIDDFAIGALKQKIMRVGFKGF